MGASPAHDDAGYSGYLMQPYYQDGICTIYHGDCRDILPELSADLVLTDPPYGINTKTKTRENQFNTAWRKHWKPVHGDQKHFDPRHLLLSFKRLVLWGANFYTGHFPAGAWLTWDKWCGLVSKEWKGMEFEYAWTNCTTENKIFTHLWHGYQRDSEIGEHYHPTQKPVALMAWCLHLFSQPGDMILDPYMGSGTTLRAAKNLGRKAIGIEIEEEHCETAVKRLAQEVLL